MQPNYTHKITCVQYDDLKPQLTIHITSGHIRLCDYNVVLIGCVKLVC